MGFWSLFPFLHFSYSFLPLLSAQFTSLPHLIWFHNRSLLLAITSFAFTTSACPSTPQSPGLDFSRIHLSKSYGRVLKGKSDSDFSTLTNDPRRKLVMLMGPDGLSLLAGKSGYDILSLIGYDPEYIRHRVETGYRFKLVIFEECGSPLLATWNNILEVIRRVYPDIAPILAKSMPEMSQVPFREIERLAGYSFFEVEKAGVEDTRFMTVDRYKNTGGGLVETRALLYFTLHLKELFAGDGFTYDVEGRKGLREYFVENKRVGEIPGCEVMDIDVKLPN